MKEGRTVSTSSVALGLGRGLGLVSRIWGQRGLGTIFQAVGKFKPLGGVDALVEFAPGDFFRTAVFESYWGPTIVGRRPYEPELRAVLSKLRGIDATFVDCGANFGYWSIVVTGRSVGFKRAVAIEPNPSTFARLQENSRANGDRFVCLQKAVSDCAGKRVTLARVEHHAVARISEGNEPGIEVETTTIDEALSDCGWLDERPVVIKIDVEGHEPAAVAGAVAVRARADHLVMFEDFMAKKLSTMLFMLGQGYKIAYVMQNGTCHAVANELEAKVLVRRDNRLERTLNFVAIKPGGALEATIESWIAQSR